MAFILKLVRFIKRKVFKYDGHFWEYFGRIHFTVQQINKFSLKEYCVLDLGGATGDNLLKKFNIKNVKTLDIKPGADIVASADKIPVEDHSIDFVTSLDMFEHIPQSLRLAVVIEMVRVAKRAVIIVAPNLSKENEWAEEYVLKYHEDEFLREHKLNGLVDFHEIEILAQRLKEEKKIKNFQTHELDNLQTWITLMLEDYANSSKTYHDIYEKFENRFIPRRKAIVIEL